MRKDGHGAHTCDLSTQTDAEESAVEDHPWGDFQVTRKLFKTNKKQPPPKAEKEGRKEEKMKKGHLFIQDNIYN